MEYSGCLVENELKDNITKGMGQRKRPDTLRSVFTDAGSMVKSEDLYRGMSLRERGIQDTLISVVTALVACFFVCFWGRRWHSGWPIRPEICKNSSVGSNPASDNQACLRA
ncbi:hypothetical protein PoB_003805900 [Plakobranchus ocellatus]|uniref:Uncharacterized protein n=1 Tax=Plakobranchus ocellatus TaxID=259542 RepID=A0AAV4AUT7_9GAST|nr:hypothetical protein PoB_003805900 [Plakobranchus ocellatus]